MRFQIECGEHYGVIEARTLGSAWRKLTRGKRSGFAPLARFVEDKPIRQVWQYITPEALDEMS